MIAVFLLQKELADTLAAVGAVQSALEVYQHLGMWNRVIECYQSAGRYGQAQQVVKERIKVEGESPRLLCLLGDATQVRESTWLPASSALRQLFDNRCTSQDASCYRKAWELSGKRSARAQRSLGLYHLRREEASSEYPFSQRSMLHRAPSLSFLRDDGRAVQRVRGEPATVAGHQLTAGVHVMGGSVVGVVFQITYTVVVRGDLLRPAS